MEDNDLKDFFWTPLFMVTGCSFLLFSGIIKLINGPHVDTFLRTGLIGIGIGCATLFTRVYGRMHHKPKSMRSAESQPE
jgi:hypothetical protein